MTKNTTSGKAATLGTLHTLMLEYYIPDTRFSLKGGYTGEEISLASDITASLSQVELGGRYYLLSQRFAVQPYGGVMVGCNLSPRRSEGVITDVRQVRSGMVQSNGMRQSLMIGAKVNFPFTISQSDGDSILDSLHEWIFGYK